MTRIDSKNVLDVILDSADSGNIIINGNRANEPFLGHVKWEHLDLEMAADIFNSSEDQHVVIDEATYEFPRVKLYQLADLECWFKVVELSPLSKSFFLVSFEDVESQTSDIEDVENYEDSF